MRRLCVSIVLSGLLISVAPAAAAAAEPLVSWLPLSPTASPRAQSGASMAFDPAINQMVLFGRARETWTYDGTTWTRQSPAVSPPARSFAAMAYDATLGKLVLYGGGSGGGPLADTWTYDGVTWAQQSPGTSPGPLSGASMAFDPLTGELVLFGGYGGNPLRLTSDTWTYDGSTWTKVLTTTSPPARSGAAMAFDPAVGRVVLFGGANGRDGICVLTQFGDTWTFDGAAWREESPISAPFGREGAVMAYDPASRELVLFGGHASTDEGIGCQVFEYFSDTWTYDGETWSRLSPSIRPSIRQSAAMAYDPRTSRLVMFGGYGFLSGDLRDTWAYQVVGTGYRLVAADGGVFAFGASYRGSTGSLRLQRPIVGMAANPGTDGYWLAASDGGVFAFGAPYFGSTGSHPPTQPVVGIAAAPDGRGYWLATRSGEVFNFGPGALRQRTTVPAQLNRPIVGISADPVTHGYRLVASDGGVFVFDSPYYGSTGNLHLNQPIVGMATDAATGGYWLVASDGGVFSFNAPFYGSTGSLHLNQPIVGITAAPDGTGYSLVARDGGVFNFGPGAAFHGSTGSLRLNQPIVGMTGS